MTGQPRSQTPGDESGGGSGVEFDRHDMGITAFWEEADPAEQQRQRRWQAELRRRGDVRLGEGVFISRLAAVYPERLVLGDRTYASAHTYFWGDVELGDDCTVNPFTEIRGTVRIGSAVRIGAHTSILGFNHTAGIDRPIYQQPLQFAGIEIGDDVWIGSHVVILDGVRIGSHSIIGAGAVVTRDVPDWSVAVGNPARILRDRRATPLGAGRDEEILERIGERVASEVPLIVAAAWDDENGIFRDRPGAEATVRAWCDAVELSSLAGAPLPIDSSRVVDELRRRQDARTGLVPDWHHDRDDVEPDADGHAGVNYHVLAAGYALELLGSSFRAPIATVMDTTARELRTGLDAQPWTTEGWRAGAWVDAMGTAMLWNRRDFGDPADVETLIGWLVTRCDAQTGMWSPVASDGSLLEPVNGFYRLTRGTFAQFGVPLPYPERTIDTVLAHAQDRRYFAPDRGTACNVLDVIHPLWLCARQTGHRRAEGEAWARAQLARLGTRWEDGRGFSFALERGSGWQRTPGLLGTEMWLAITWLLADYLAESDILPFRPRGIHRPEPAIGSTSR